MVKYYIAAAVVALSLIAGGAWYYASVTKEPVKPEPTTTVEVVKDKLNTVKEKINDTVKYVEDVLKSAFNGVEVGSDAWFDTKKKQYDRLVDNVASIKYELRGATDWNVATSLRFALNTNIKTCQEVVTQYNEQVKIKQPVGRTELSLESCQ